MSIHEHGYWLTAQPDAPTETGIRHRLDKSLLMALVTVFDGAHVLDLGCGSGGYYVRALRAAGVMADGYDGNPNTLLDSEGICQVADLTVPLVLPPVYNWVLCLEVGEHVPVQYEKEILDNVARNCLFGAVLSWGIPGQDGQGHVNCRDNVYIQDQMAARGLVHDDDTARHLREAATLAWFKNTIMVFLKI